MLNGPEQDELKKLEKRVYRYVACFALFVGIRQHNPLGQFSRLNVDDLSQ